MYYRRFIQGYASISKPLHDNLKKDSYVCNELQEDVFTALQKVMTAPPVLTLPNFSYPFMLETYASRQGLRVVLMQQGKPIAYLSKSLGPKAAAQSIYEKGLAILQSLRKWIHYLQGNKPIIKTDYKIGRAHV